MNASPTNDERQSAMNSIRSDNAPEATTLPIVPAGQMLIEHEVYIDTALRGHGPFRALPGQVAASGNGYVAERDVDPATWDQLVRADGEVHLQETGENAASQSGAQLKELGAAV